MRGLLLSGSFEFEFICDTGLNNYIDNYKVILDKHTGMTGICKVELV
jgi:hypothetical protein